MNVAQGWLGGGQESSLLSSARGMFESLIAPLPSVQQRIGALSEQFATKKRVVIDDLLEPSLLERIADELVSLRYEPIANVPLERTTSPVPQLWFHHSPVEVTEGKPLSPLRALVLSMTRGLIFELVRAVTGRELLRDEYEKKERPGLVAYAYPRGGYIESHVDGGSVDGKSRRSVALVFYGSREWQPSWGGELRFAADSGERYFPKFGALCFFDVGPHNRHEVTMVTGPEVRYSVAGFLVEPQ